MILWKSTSDRQLVAMSDSKKILPIAEVVCDVARERGVTEVVMLDHTMEAKMEACCPLHSWVFLKRFFKKHSHIGLDLCTVLSVGSASSHSRQDDGSGGKRPMQYRYTIVPCASVNAFKPKEVAPDAGRLNMRSPELGGIFAKRCQQIPVADHCSMVWEAIPFVPHHDTATPHQ